ncbi:MAG TPA: hypothetical protein VHG34_03485 [Nitrososphaeraceae archaeon]|jgi:hypothetical protein|nr:hypothetical protein [Nitrososphaeraceae archaeon]
MSYNECQRKIMMSTKKEHPENYGWWISELDSLGIKRMKRNDMKDRKEITDLAKNIKQTFFQKYKTVYNQ